MNLIEYHPNPDYITIHRDVEVVSFSTEYQKDKTPEWANKILALPGVTKVSSYDKYQVSIGKGKAFDWETILCSVCPIMEIQPTNLRPL